MRVVKLELSVWISNVEIFHIMKIKKVLFVCTGNYFRSRFAQAFFNYLGDQQKNHPSIHWQAFSRGFEISLLNSEQRKVPVSEFTMKKLNEMQIPLSYVQGQPTQVSQADLDRADRIVLMNEREHRRYLEHGFPGLDLKKVCFWHVEDIDQIAPTIALEALRVQVEKLFLEL